MNTFEINLAGLSMRYPALVEDLRRVRGGRLTITAARTGIPTATESGRAIHSAYDPQKEAMTWAEAQTTALQPGEVAVVLGVGLLYHVEALRRRLPRENRIAVVVADLSTFHDALACRSLGDWLDRVDWVWGDAREVATTLMSLEHPLRFVTYAPAARLHAEEHDAIKLALRRMAAQKAGAQLHVAVVGPIYGGSLPIARYTTSALEFLGHRVTWIDHSHHDRSYHSLADIKDARQRAAMQSRFAELLSQLTVVRLSEDPPDLVLALAQAPLTLPMLHHVRQKKLITAMWFVENYRHLTYWQQLAGGYDYWFIIQQGAFPSMLKQAGAGHVNYLPVAADPSVHRPLDLSNDDRVEFGADVSFVGAGYANRRAILPRLIGQPYMFKVWGNEWVGAHALAGALQRQGQRIDTQTCIKVFNASRINLNLHSCIGEGLDPDGDFINPRAFELAASGAFQLLDQRSLLPELFNEKEMTSFHSPDDLLGQIPGWLHEHEARAAMARAARERVLREHTYVHRMRDLLSQVGMTQPDRVGAVLRGERTAGSLVPRSTDHPALSAILTEFPSSQRVELKDVAERIRSRGPTAELTQDHLLLLLLDEYRMERRDLV
ncbi:MAG TPA: glycosyltransferase [Nitrospiraceae bacterium]|nr:glycosyltransferase [Nitrospiraceae bacterium]